MELPRNAFKRALAEKWTQLGLWSNFCSNVSAEIIAHAGFDWIVVDGEHAPNEVPAILSQLQALAAGTSTPVVRVPWNDPVIVKRVLDIGAQSVLFPFIQNAEEARRAVAATRYPPDGVRGVATATRASRFGRVKGYLNHASEEICVLVQVETRTALDAIEAIATVDGVDGVFIGPSDLAASFGHLGNHMHPEVQAAIGDAILRLKAVGKAGGYLTGNEDEARKRIAEGFTFVALGSETSLLVKSCDELVRRFKS